MSRSPLCELLGLRYPILQAPTGSVAGPELAAAVSAAGGLGGMGLTWTEPETAADYVRHVRAAAPGGAPFQVNFALHFPPRALDAALEAGAPVVTFSWGDPSPFIARVRAAGARFGVQVTSAAGARRAALDLGADFVICQGVESGGHVQGTAPLWELLPQVVAAAADAGTPVVAAGGIADGAGISRALSLGASGAMLGTRFVATRESRAHPDYKAALLAARAGDTTLTLCFDGGWPQAAHRVLRNATLDAWEAHGSPTHAAGARPGEGDVVAHASGGEAILRYEDTAPRVGMTGNIAEMCLYAGTGVGAITDLPSAAEVVARLAAEAFAYYAPRLPH